jgi:hypothetical protein
VQLDVRDVNNNLIPPWKFYDALKPGTLVLALVSLHCFAMTDDGGKERKERKVFPPCSFRVFLTITQIYQMNAHSIRVLSESDEPVEERTRPIPPNAPGRAIANLPARALTASFANFAVPSVTAAHASPSSTSTASGDTVFDEMAGTEDAGKAKATKHKRTRKEL